MKKILLLISLAMIMFVSCTKSDVSQENDSLDQGQVSLKVACFGAMGNQAVGGVRYILELYSASDIAAWKEDNTISIIPFKRFEYKNDDFATDQGNPFALEFRVIPGDYHILIWADRGVDYYDATSLLAITSLKNGVAGDDKKEAFSYTGVLKVDGNTILPQLTLKHAVGKVSVRTTDIHDLYVNSSDLSGSHINVEDVSFTYNKYYSVLNLLNHALTEEGQPRTLTYTPTVDYSVETADVFVDYTFMPNNDNVTQNSMSFTANLSNGGAQTFTKESVSMFNNEHTIFSGNALTMSVNVQVIVDSDFNQNEINTSDSKFSPTSIDPAFEADLEGSYIYSNFSSLGGSGVGLGSFLVDDITKIAVEVGDANCIGFVKSNDGKSVYASLTVAENKTPYENDMSFVLRSQGATTTVSYKVSQDAGASVVLLSTATLGFDTQHNKDVEFKSNHIIDVNAVTLSQAAGAAFTVTLNSFTSSAIGADFQYTYTANVSVGLNETDVSRMFSIVCIDQVTGLALSPIMVEQESLDGTIELSTPAKFTPYGGTNTVICTVTGVPNYDASELVLGTDIPAWVTITGTLDTQLSITVTNNEKDGSIISGNRLAVVGLFYKGKKVDSITINQDGFTWSESVSGARKVNDSSIESHFRNPEHVTINITTNRNLTISDFTLGTNSHFTGNPTYVSTSSGGQFKYQFGNNALAWHAQRSTSLSITDPITSKLITPKYNELRQWRGASAGWDM